MIDSSRRSSGPDSIERKILQRRLSAYGRIVAAFLGAYLLVFNYVNLLNPAYSWRDWAWNGSNLLHAAAALAMVVVWLACRTVDRSMRFLWALDAAGLLFVGLAFIASVHVSDPSGSRNFAMQLELANLMLARSVLVPSSGQRTMVLCAALVPFATLAVADFDVRRGFGGVTVIRHGAEAFVSCSIAVGIATIASQVIFGLRAKVRAATMVGQYTLLEKLGEGGMGVVYLASHAMLRRSTAVKLLPPDKSDDWARERFENEVQHTSKLTHPNTVAIYDYGRTRDGVFYFAMEYLDGLNLQDLVSRFGPQSPARVVHILRQICGSLAEAHAVGLVHRDVKPANLLLCERGGRSDVVKVVDFGLVRGFVGGGESASDVAAVGTPLHMSPESIRSPETVEPRSDIYAVGTVAYYLLTGVQVFGGATIQEIFAGHLYKEAAPPSTRFSGIPKALDALVLSCLAKDVGERPISALALREALGAIEGLGPWTQRDAHEWWGRYRNAPSAAPETGAATDATTDLTRTIRLDVDLKSRAAAAAPDATRPYSD
jgi:serine/threonine-protein kinase